MVLLPHADPAVNLGRGWYQVVGLVVAGCCWCPDRLEQFGHVGHVMSYVEVAGVGTVGGLRQVSVYNIIVIMVTTI